MFLATGVELSSKPKTEASETIEMELVSIERAFELARSGAMKTDPCALAALLCESLFPKPGAPQPTPDNLLET